MLSVFLAMARPKTTENASDDAATSEAVDAGRYAYAHAYMRLSAALRKQRSAYQKHSDSDSGIGDALPRA
jgi:hypothetical protein